MHLIMDGYGSDPALLQDEKLLHDLLDTYPEEMGMTKIAPPIIYRYVGSKPEDWGISGIVVIAESHISIHTFVEHLFVNVDVFSCKDFDAERIMKDLKEKLGLVEVRSHILDRGPGSYARISTEHSSSVPLASTLS